MTAPQKPAPPFPRSARHSARDLTAQGTLAAASLLFLSTLTGCLMIGGSSRGGFFIFPGGIGLVVIIVIVALLLRRR